MALRFAIILGLLAMPSAGCIARTGPRGLASDDSAEKIPALKRAGETRDAALALTPYDHDPQESPRQHRVPQATPGLDLGARFARMRLPPLSGLRQGFGRANQVAFFARAPRRWGVGGGGPS